MDTRNEYYNGRMYAMAGGTYDHGQIITNIVRSSCLLCFGRDLVEWWQTICESAWQSMDFIRIPTSWWFVVSRNLHTDVVRRSSIRDSPGRGVVGIYGGV